jgi:hypothetical protein
MELTNSKRLLYTASYVASTREPQNGVVAASNSLISANTGAVAGNSFVKANILRSMELKPESIPLLLKTIKEQEQTEYRDDMVKLATLAQRLNDTTKPASTVEIAQIIAPITMDAITQFAEIAAPVMNNMAIMPIIFFFIRQLAFVMPIGRIHLERIEMYPVGEENGELVFSVPMAPGETVTISHREWSTTSNEYEDIVTDFFESYSERGVADKTDASMSSESESKRSSSLDFGATLSGSYMGVTLTSAFSTKSTNEERDSVKLSMQKNREVTEKASARSRKEHKVSMKVESKAGTEDQSGRTITNPGTTPIRIDYYRMMRKWRTDLYRYGLRMTYDFTMPLPGVRLWALHERIAELDKDIRGTFSFALNADDITVGNWPDKAKEFGAPPEIVPHPPKDEIHVPPKEILIDYSAGSAYGPRLFGKIDFETPIGYTLSLANAIAIYAPHGGGYFAWAKGSSVPSSNVAETTTITGHLENLIGLSGAMSASYFHHDLQSATLSLELRFKVTVEKINAWKIDAWSAIKASAEARYHEEIARKQEERDRLWRSLNGKDTLTLRRLEREELLRLVMQWLIGPNYSIASDVYIQETLKMILQNESKFQQNQLSSSETTNPTLNGISVENWWHALLFGEAQVKFIHQAIEWENLLYFLYPYFWGSDVLGRDKMLFEHADPEHERFLRAGYVRIVIPVRPGFEEQFARFLHPETILSDQSNPYIPIAQEIYNYAKTNYAGIPPANPEKNARPLLYPEQRATWDSMQKAMEYIEDFKKISGKYPDALDDLPSVVKDASDNPIVVPVDAWGRPFIYKLPGLGADYDLLSLGANGVEGGEEPGKELNADISSAAGASLVATWFDYTPTSALDIEVVTKPELVA